MPELLVPAGESQGVGLKRSCLSLIPSTELLERQVRSSTTGNAGKTLLVSIMDSLHPEMWKRNREFDFNSKANNLKPVLEKLEPTATGVQALL